MMMASSLVLVPGLMCDAAVWQSQVDALSGRIDVQIVDHGELDSLTGMEFSL